MPEIHFMQPHFSNIDKVLSSKQIKESGMTISEHVVFVGWSDRIDKAREGA